jgi:hypothetical protein
LKLGQERACGHSGRREVAHDHVRRHRGSDRVGRGDRDDVRAGQIEHRANEMERVLLVGDEEDANSPELGDLRVTHTPETSGSVVA